MGFSLNSSGGIFKKKIAVTVWWHNRIEKVKNFNWTPPRYALLFTLLSYLIIVDYHRLVSKYWCLALEYHIVPLDVFQPKIGCLLSFSGM